MSKYTTVYLFCCGAFGLFLPKNKAVVNICVQAFCRHVFVVLGQILGSRIAKYRACVQIFPIWLHHFTLLPAASEHSSSTSLPTFDIISLFNVTPFIDVK